MPPYLFWVIVSALAAWYVSYYYRYPSEVTIIQTTLPEFHFDLLLQKQPIVLQDQVSHLSDLQRLWFPRMTQYRVWTEKKSMNDPWDKNKHKYLVLQPHSDTKIFLYPRGKEMVPPGIPDPKGTLIEIQLKSHQVLIVPYKYYYHIEDPITLHGLACDDLLTYILP